MVTKLIVRQSFSMTHHYPNYGTIIDILVILMQLMIHRIKNGGRWLLCHLVVMNIGMKR
jgi:hypothetical protein